MEYSQSQVWGDTEECHSSESGWTMYIDSPVHQDGIVIDDDDDDDKEQTDDGDGDGDDDDGHDSGDGYAYGYGAKHDTDDDDDSMASDASSGPTHQEHAHGTHVMMPHGHDNGSYVPFEKDLCKTAGRGRRERRKGEEEKNILKPNREVTSFVQNGGGPKVRTKSWLGRRK